MPFGTGFDSSGNGWLTLGGMSAPSELMRILEQDAIDPGSDPGYQACKTIYAHHPLAPRIVDKPLQMAMSQERLIEIPGAPEEDLKKAFKKEWKRIGAIGADNIIYRGVQLSQIYGISTLCANVLKKSGGKEDPADPMPWDDMWELDIYFNLYDPLNTAGSLVLNQDSGAVDFMHPKQVSVGSQVWSNTKSLVLMHEQPIWIEWSNSAFGFVGRSVFQRALFPLKSFVTSMLADEMVQAKLGLIVWKAKSAGSIADMAARAFKAMQRFSLKNAKTNSVVSIGESEALETLNMQHVADAGKYSRDNILKNIAAATGRPASLLTQETLAEGFGEGTEDAKLIAQFIDRLRIEMNPAYEFMDNIVQRRAWNPVFFKDMQKRFPERYADMTYNAAFQSWQDAWTATWPNLLTEPDSEKAKGSQAKLETATKIATVILSSQPGPETKGAVCAWLADAANDEKDFLSSQLLIDAEAIAEYEPEPLPGGMGDDPEGPQNANAAPRRDSLVDH